MATPLDQICFPKHPFLETCDTSEDPNFIAVATTAGIAAQIMSPFLISKLLPAAVTLRTVLSNILQITKNRAQSFFWPFVKNSLEENQSDDSQQKLEIAILLERQIKLRNELEPEIDEEKHKLAACVQTMRYNSQLLYYLAHGIPHYRPLDVTHPLIPLPLYIPDTDTLNIDNYNLRAGKIARYADKLCHHIDPENGISPICYQYQSFVNLQTSENQKMITIRKAIRFTELTQDAEKHMTSIIKPKSARPNTSNFVIWQYDEDGCKNNNTLKISCSNLCAKKTQLTNHLRRKLDEIDLALDSQGFNRFSRNILI